MSFGRLHGVTFNPVAEFHAARSRPRAQSSHSQSLFDVMSPLRETQALLRIRKLEVPTFANVPGASIIAPKLRTDFQRTLTCVSSAHFPVTKR